jgi:hypothetical protein
LDTRGERHKPPPLWRLLYRSKYGERSRRVWHYSQNSKPGSHTESDGYSNAQNNTKAPPDSAPSPHSTAVKGMVNGECCRLLGELKEHQGSH